VAFRTKAPFEKLAFLVLRRLSVVAEKAGQLVCFVVSVSSGLEYIFTRRLRLSCKVLLGVVTQIHLGRCSDDRMEVITVESQLLRRQPPPPHIDFISLHVTSLHDKHHLANSARPRPTSYTRIQSSKGKATHVQQYYPTNN
jgi:hypothetical protein